MHDMLSSCKISVAGDQPYLAELFAIMKMPGGQTCFSAKTTRHKMMHQEMISAPCSLRASTVQGRSD